MSEIVNCTTCDLVPPAVGDTVFLAQSESDDGSEWLRSAKPYSSKGIYRVEGWLLSGRDSIWNAYGSGIVRTLSFDDEGITVHVERRPLREALDVFRRFLETSRQAA